MNVSLGNRGRERRLGEQGQAGDSGKVCSALVYGSFFFFFSAVMSVCVYYLHSHKYTEFK